jgi:nucleotide-binding universal stress UspA family protein
VVRRVVVPLDGSSEATVALRPGFAVAARAGAPLLAVRVADTNDAGIGAWLHRQVDRFDGVADHDVAVVPGPVAPALQAAAGEAGTLLCMASHGRTGLRRVVLGSVAEAVVRTASRPVLVVGPAGRVVPLHGERATMVICSDGSARAEQVLDPAIAFARDLALVACVVEVIGPDEDVALAGGPPPEPLRRLAERRGQDLCRRLADAGIPATNRVLFGADAARSIIAAADDLGACYIALATHGRAGVARHALGSVAAAVVRAAPCPVLVQRAA